MDAEMEVCLFQHIFPYVLKSSYFNKKKIVIIVLEYLWKIKLKKVHGYNQS